MENEHVLVIFTLTRRCRGEEINKELERHREPSGDHFDRQIEISSYVSSPSLGNLL